MIRGKTGVSMSEIAHADGPLFFETKRLERRSRKVVLCQGHCSTRADNVPLMTACSGSDNGEVQIKKRVKKRIVAKDSDDESDAEMKVCAFHKPMCTADPLFVVPLCQALLHLLRPCQPSSIILGQWRRVLCRVANLK